MSFVSGSWKSLVGLRSIVVLCLGLGGALLACGSDDEASGTTYAYPTEYDFCQALASAQCSSEVVTRCYGADAASLEDNTATCHDVRDPLKLCNAARLDYHPEGGEACVKAYKDAYRDAVLTSAEQASIAQACLIVFHNGGLVGTECTQDTDCHTGAGFRCVLKPDGGTCQVPVEVQAGRRCEAAEEQCEAGFQCDGRNCVLMGETDDACSDTVLCGEGFSCVGSAQPVCQAKKANGSACTEDSACTGTFCIKAAGQDAGTCASSERFELTGATCATFRP